MKLYTLKRSITVPAPLEEVFDFFSLPENLEAITPPNMRMTILTPSPAPMHVGSMIDYLVRVQNVPLRWTTAITEYAPAHRFVDLQVRGPYSLWHHTHTFMGTPAGTLICDEVRYAMPFGPLGRLVHWLKVHRDLKYIYLNTAPRSLRSSLELRKKTKNHGKPISIKGRRDHNEIQKLDNRIQSPRTSLDASLDSVASTTRYP
jgi:ligand-binding SRPBCC domain-containing protein